MKFIVITFIALFFSHPHTLLSQGEGNNWFFGNYVGLSFSTNPPTILNNGALETGEGSASVSGKNGLLAFYTDGQFVWDANHNLMPNGTGLLGHPSSTQSAIIFPKPSTYNYSTQRYNGYFIVTIDEGIVGSNGVRFTEVNMNLNGGMGDVVVTNKNIHLFGTTTMEGATVAKHANGCDYWIIGKPIGNNSIYAYLVTSSGVNLIPVISTTGPTIFAGWGAIKASMNSQMIGIAGFYRTIIYDFDNSTGILSHRYTSLKGGYSLEFSPNNNILYATNLNDPNIYQYDLSTTTQLAFLASELIVGTTANTVGYRMCGLQLAPNGKIYAALQDQERLGAINNPNVLGLGCNYSDNQQSLVGVNSFSGSTMYSNLGLPAFPSFFFEEPLEIHASFLCHSESTRFKLSNNINISSVDWYWTSSGNPLPNLPNSNEWEPENQFATPGNYDVLAVVNYPCYVDSIYKTITITNVNELNIGNDTTLCFGNSTTLDAGQGFDYYKWHDGSGSQTYLANTTGQYIVEVGNTGANLILNGDFELGNSEIETDYFFTTSNPQPGSFSVTNLSSGLGANCQDHTSGNGTMMMEINASCGLNGVATNANLWCQTIDVAPNTDYLFSAWIAQASTFNSQASIALFINGLQIGNPVSTTSSPCEWVQLKNLWNSGTTTSIDLCIRETSSICLGSNFILDDIFFSQLCKTSDTINVTINALPTATITGNASVCQNAMSPLVTFTGANATPPYTFNYNIDGGSSQTLTSTGNIATISVPTNNAGTFTYNLISVVDASGTLCSQNQTGNALIVVHPLPTITVPSSGNLCVGSNLNLTPSMGGTWSSSNPSVATITNGGLVSGVSSGTSTMIFSNTITGCSSLASSGLITVTSPPDAGSLSGSQNVCVGSSVTFNSTQSGGTWTSSNTGVATVNSSTGVITGVSAGTSTITYIVLGTGGCADATATRTVTVNPLPTITVPSSGTLCVSSTLNLTPSTGGIWSSSNPSIATITNSGLVSGVSSGTTTMIFTNTTTGCSSLASSGLINVNPLPTATSNGNVSVCQNATSPLVTFTGANATAPYIFTYTLNGGSPQTLVSNGDIATILVPTNVVGTLNYNILGVEDASSAACSVILDESVSVVVNPLPTAQIIGGDSLCVNTGSSQVEFIGDNGIDSYTFIYNVNGGSLQSVTSNFGSNNAVLDINASQDGIFVYTLISVIENSFGCSQDEFGEVVIVVHPDPIASFTPSPKVIMFSDNVSQMVNTSSGATAYIWNFGDGSSSSLVSPHHQFEVEDLESFTITLTAISEFGCISTAVDVISIEEDELIYIPNTFTPDGNDFNSVFKPVASSGIDIYSFTMDIYNRWGEMIFTTHNIDIGWDGTYNGVICQDGVYEWVISYKPRDKPNYKKLHGHLNLLK